MMIITIMMVVNDQRLRLGGSEGRGGGGEYEGE